MEDSASKNATKRSTNLTRSNLKSPKSRPTPRGGRSSYEIPRKKVSVADVPKGGSGETQNKFKSLFKNKTSEESGAVSEGDKSGNGMLTLDMMNTSQGSGSLRLRGLIPKTTKVHNLRNSRDPMKKIVFERTPESSSRSKKQHKSIFSSAMNEGFKK
jgi:hypothetical protein